MCVTGMLARVQQHIHTPEWVQHHTHAHTLVGPVTHTHAHLSGSRNALIHTCTGPATHTHRYGSSFTHTPVQVQQQALTASSGSSNTKFVIYNKEISRK